MRHRKLLTPSFHFKILEEFVPCFNHQSKTLIEVLKEEGANKKEINICTYMSLCTLDIVCGRSAHVHCVLTKYAFEFQKFMAVMIISSTFWFWIDVYIYFVESVMGRRINAQRDKTSEYVKAVYG